MKNYFILLLFFILNVIVLEAQEILSPNKNIKVVVSENSSGQVFFKAMYKKDADLESVKRYTGSEVDK